MRPLALICALLLLTGPARASVLAHGDPAFEAWIAKLKPTSVSIVYAAQFGGNPGSYMGHLFLKIRSQKRGPARSQTIDLIDQTFGFVALIPEGTPALVYAYKGLFGGFPGGFIANDFYQLTFEYQSIESRDLWEYEVALTPPELRRLLEVLWERMHHAPFPYRFFDENCAAMLGDMLWQVKPAIRQGPGRTMFTTPHDVVHWLAQNGLIASTKAWPSERAAYLGRLARVDPEVGSAVEADFQAKRVAPGMDYRYYDALVARFDYEEAKTKKQPTPEFEQAREAALGLLAKAPLPTVPQPEILPETTDPVAAHPMTLALLAVGRKAESRFADWEIRPAGHDLLDPAAGFSDDMGLAFIAGRLRYDADAQLLRLRYLDLMRMKNLTPFTWLDQAPAWSFRLGAYDWGAAPFARGYVGASGGIGLSTSLFGVAKAWLLTGATGRFGLSERRGDVGPNVEMGWLAHVGARLRLLATSETYLPYDTKGRREPVEQVLSLGMALTVAKVTDLRLEFTGRRDTPAELAVAVGRFF